MGVWEYGNKLLTAPVTCMNKGFQRIVNHVALFQKNISTLPYSHTPILVFVFSKFLFVFNKNTFSHQK